jgi:capsular polysaccharide biosynthesis protein
MTVGELMELLRKHLAFIIILPVLFALATACVSFFLPNEYTATTLMYVLSKSMKNTDDPNSTGTGYDNLSAGQLLANDVVSIAKSDRVGTDVARQLGMNSLRGYKVDIQSTSTSRIITLNVTGADPRRTATVANTYVQRISQTATSVMGVPNVNVVDRASVPKQPSGPKRTLYCVAALIVGFILAVIIVVMADRMNTKIRNDDEAQAVTGLPVIAHFPRVRA